MIFYDTGGRRVWRGAKLYGIILLRVWTHQPISLYLPTSFLAAISSSRSDVVTQSVCVFVCVLVPFFSFSVLGGFFLVLKSFNPV